MLLSFFSSGYITGSDQSHNPDCLYQEDIDVDLSTHTPTLVEVKGKKSIQLIPIAPPSENESQKRQRIRQLIISAPDIAKVNLEGVVFSDQEKGEIISQAVYGGNIYSEIAESFTYSTIIDKAISARTATEKTKLIEILARIAKKELIKTKLK